jgi:hypothetical protein
VSRTDARGIRVVVVAAFGQQDEEDAACVLGVRHGGQPG